MYIFLTLIKIIPNCCLEENYSIVPRDWELITKKILIVAVNRISASNQMQTQISHFLL